MADDTDFDPEANADWQDQLERQQGGIGGYAPVTQPTIAPTPIPTDTTATPAPAPAPAIGPPRPSTLSPATQAYLASRQAQRPNPDAGIDPNWKFDKSLIQEEAPSDDKGIVHDLAVASWNHVRSVGQSLVGWGQFLNDQTLNNPELRGMMQSATDSLQKDIQTSWNSLSPASKTADRASILRTLGLGPEVDEQGNKIPGVFEAGFGRWLGMRVAENPEMAAAMVVAPEGVVGKALVAGAFGAMNAGDTYNTILKGVRDADDAKFQAENPIYRQYRQTMSEDQAKAQVMGTVWPSVLGAAALGGATGLGITSFLGRGAAGSSLGSWVARRALGGLEGALPMGAQTGGDEALTQAAQLSLGQRDSLDIRKIEEETLSGAIGGGVLGAITGAHKAAPKEETGTGATRDPDVNTAVSEVIPPGGEGGPPGGAATAPVLALPPPGGRPGETITMPGTAGQGPVNWRDVNVAPVTQRPEPPPPPPTTPVAAQPAEFRPPVEPTAAPAAAETPAAREGAPTPGVTPGAPAPSPRPSEGMRVGDLRDALVRDYGISQQEANRLNRDQAASRFDREAGRSAAQFEQKAAAETGAQPEIKPAATEEVAEKSPEVAPETKVAETPITGTQVEPKVEAAKQEAAPEPKVTPVAAETKPALPSNAEMREQLKAWGHKATFVRNLKVAELPGVYAKELEARATPESAAARERELKGEPEPVAAGEAEENPVRTQAMEHLAAVAQAAGVDKLPPKDPRTKAIRAAMAEMQRAFENVNTEEDVLTHLRTQQGPAREGESGIAYTLRRNLAAQIESRYTGEKPTMEKTLKARQAEAKAAEEAAARKVSPVAEVMREEQERGGGGAKATSAEAIEEKATGAGEGGQTMGLEPVHAKVRKTTDLKVKGQQWLRKVLDDSDPTTLEHAVEQFGKQGTGPGRPRREATTDFSRIVEDELKRVDNPERKADLEKKLIQVYARDRDIGTGEPSELSDKIVKALEDYAPSRVDKLRNLLSQLRDPVHEAAEHEALGAKLKAEIAARRPVEDAPLPPEPAGISPRSSRYVMGSADPRLSANYERVFGDRIRGDGEPVMAREAAQMVAQDPMVRAEQGPLREVAERFARIVPPDVPIMSLDRAFREGRISQPLFADLHSRGVYGAYDPLSRTILHNLDAQRLTGSHVETALHEMSHSISYHYLDNLTRSDKFHPDLRALNAIRGELSRHVLSEAVKGNLSEMERQRLLKAIKDNHEMHTQLFTDPVVQGFAASRRASPALLDQLRANGHPGMPGQSIWRSFANWVRKAVGQPPAKSASEFTLFDHIIKPVTDIQDRAVEYNKRYLPEDSALRRTAEPLYDMASTLGPRGQAVAEHVLDRVDVAGKAALARRGALTAIPTHGVHRTWGDLFNNFAKTIAEATGQYAKPFLKSNPFDDLIEQNRNITRVGMDVRDTDGKLVRPLAEAFANSKNRAELGQLMADAGTVDANGNARHYVGSNIPPGRTADPALQARYNALSPTDRATFDGMQQLFAKWGKGEQDAELLRMFNQTIPEATDAQRDAMVAAGKNQASIQRFLADPDNSNVAQAFGGDWSKNADFLKALGKYHEHGFIGGTYFPLKRPGDWVVTHGEAGTPDYTVKMFESRTQAERYRQEQIKNNTPGVSQVASKAEATGSDMALNHPAVSDLYSKIINRPGFDKAKAEDVRRTLNEILLQRSGRSNQFGSAMERQGIRGAHTDYGRILNEELINHAIRVGNMEHGAARQDAIVNMKRVARWLELYGNKGDGVAARQVAEEMEKRSTVIDDYNNPLHSALGKINAWAFVKQLLSPSHWITSTMEAHTMALPQIAADIGGVTGDLQAAAAMANNMRKLAITGMMKNAKGTFAAALGQLKASDWSVNRDLGKVFRKGNAVLADAMMDMFHRTGLIDHSYSADLYRNAQGRGILGGKAAALAEHMMAMTTYGQHVFDASNKWVIGMTAAETYLRRNAGDIKGAVEYGRRIVEDSMPDYSPWNKARIATRQGALRAFGPNAMQFKNYGFFLYSRLGALVHDIAYGDDKVRAARALTGILAYHALTAGVVGLVADPLRYALGAYDWATGAKKPHDYQVNSRQVLESWFGKTWGELLGAGMTHALGIDVQHRVGLMNPIEMPELSAFSGDAYSSLLAKALFGAAGDTLASTVGGMTKALQGDVMGGIMDMAPRPIRDVMKAWNLSQQGVTVGGKPVLPAERIPSWQIGMQALGFQPAIKEEAVMQRHAMQQARDEATEARTDIRNRWLEAATTPGGDRHALDSEIRQYNADPRHTKLTYTQLYKDLENYRKQARAPGGLRLPKQTARALQAEGSFANVP